MSTTTTAPRDVLDSPKSVSPEEEQSSLLKEAKKQVEIEGYHMRKALDKNQLEEALKHSAKMLNELRTSVLLPKNYYELYMAVFDQLRHLEVFFREENSRGRKMHELYEVVQHAGNIVPRLYLLIAVGSVYVSSKEAPAKKILKDLVEMCKGVQHPTRGLFLRHFMSQIMKDKLPDKGSIYEGDGGDVKDAIEFVLQNFKDTVNLFSRLKSTGTGKEREKREKERKDLRILVGTNLFRLSQLDGIDQVLYKESVLPKILQVITESKDTIAQQYLMEVIIQVFPDDFHIATLDTFLQACLTLESEVDMKVILTSLMDRLANYAKQFPQNIPSDINIVDVFQQYISKINDNGLDMSDMLSVKISLMNLSLQTYREKIEYVNDILKYCGDRLKKDDMAKEDIVKLTKQLLLVPVESYKNVLVLLELDKYSKVQSLLAFKERKEIAVQIVKSALKFKHFITNWEQVNKLFDLIRPLIKDEDDTPQQVDEDEFVEEQNLVARLVHLCNNEDTDVLFKVYSTARKHYGQGGIRRIQYTLVPLVFAYLQLAQRIHSQGLEKSIKEEKVFQYVIEILEVLAGQKPGSALMLYLQAAMCADQCGLEKMAYEAATQAFMLYEEEDSKVQLDHLTLIINTLTNLKNISEQNFETLSTKTCQYSSKLLRKPDQCRAAFSCSHLFWPANANPKVQNSSKALECLQWSLKIVKACLASQQIPIFVEILNVYMHHFDKRNDKVTPEYLNGLIDLINTNIANAEEEEGKNGALAPISIFYRNTIKYLTNRKAEDEQHYSEVKAFQDNNE